MFKKKLVTMAVVGVILLSGVVFSTVYKGRTEGESVQVETVAPKETEEIEVKTDKGTTVLQQEITVNEIGKIVMDTEEEEIERIKKRVESVDESLLETEETLSLEEANKNQEIISEKIDSITYDDSLGMAREVAKVQVKELAVNNEEFREFTDEKIDNLSEEELSALTGKIVKAVRGY